MDAFLEALSQLATFQYWFLLAIAIVIGTIVGFIPGVGATLVTAILLPSVLLLIDEPAVGIVFLAMIGSLNNTLNAIPAVLVGLPESETQVTYFEGHQLARQGKAAFTLGAVYSTSAVGGVIGAAALLASIPFIKPLILQFSYAEIAMLALFGIAMVALLSRGNMAKGLAAGFMGLLLGTVGVDPFSGADRFTFGQIQLWQGLPIITTILGFFALPELIDLTLTRQPVASADADVSRKEVFRGAIHGLKRWPMVIRQSLFGMFMGAIPGIGGAVIDWLAYAFGISLTKDKEKHNFGRGSIEGVMFAESANNSKAGGQALPTLTLGIPGSTSWAIIAVAMLSYGFSPGPSMVNQHLDITMLMVLTLAIGNVIVAVIGLFATNYLARVTRIPYATVGFMIMGMVFLAAYMDLANWFVLLILSVFVGIGLLMKQFGWPRPPLILGFILGPIVEQNLLSALSIYGVVGTITRPVAVVLFVLIVISIWVLMRIGSKEPDVTAMASVAAGDGFNEALVDAATLHDGTSSGTESGVALEATQDEEDFANLPLRARVLQPANAAPAFFIIVAIAFMIPTLSFPTEARSLPLATSLGVLLLSVYQLVKQIRLGDVSDGQVMDLGMRSTEEGGSGQAVLMISALFLMFFLLAGTLGLQIASVALATIGPAVFLQGRARWVSAVVSGAVVLVFSTVVMDRIVGVIWPDPFILSWLGVG
jgi:TctA family transporter